MNIFVSVGSPASDRQEAFVSAVEARLRAVGMVPSTVGRNTFSANAPLKAVTELMGSCSGAVIIAFERLHFPTGIEKRGGPHAKGIADVKLATPWNQIEAAMAYDRDLPLLVIAENGLRSEGLIERGYDWYVQWVDLDLAALNSAEFNGILSDWSGKVRRRAEGAAKAKSTTAGVAPMEMTVGQLVGALKPAQLWTLVGTAATIVAGAFALGAKLGAL